MEPHGAIGFEQTGVQLPGSTELHPLAVRIKYANDHLLREVFRMNCSLHYIRGRQRTGRAQTLSYW